jgi:hypothetical protein
MNINFEKTKYKTLTWCKEDWTPLYYIYSFVEEFFRYKDLDLTKKETLEITKDLLENNLVVAGDLLPGNNFVPWKLSLDGIMQKIEYDWNNLKHGLAPFEIDCFDTTDKGKKELEYLDSLPELKESIYYYRICEGGQKGAEELLNKLAKDAQLIKNDTLRKVKVYKLLDNTQFCYREHSKFGMRINTIDIKFSDIKKYIQFKFTDKV